MQNVLYNIPSAHQCEDQARGNDRKVGRVWERLGAKFFIVAAAVSITFVELGGVALYPIEPAKAARLVERDHASMPVQYFHLVLS